MEQNSSNKVVSLHMQKCEGNCPHSSCCYHLKKNINQEQENKKSNLFTCSMIVGSRKYGYTIYDSRCKPLEDHDFKLLTKNPNYNITISYNDICNEKIGTLLKYKDQLQITVYTSEQILILHEFQKLFLVKDRGSWHHCFNIIDDKTDNIGRLHFPINISDKYVRLSLPVLIKHFNENARPGLSLDSCLTSWIINGKCPYNNDNYVDITYDLTTRKCPFNKNGTNLENQKIDTLFTTAAPAEQCIYEEIFNDKRPR
jgi:hypothetical protein